MAKETEINVYEIATTVVNSIPGMASSIAVIGAFNSEITDITNVSGARIAHSLFGTSTTFGTFKGTDTIDYLFLGASNLLVANITTWTGDETPVAETTLTNEKLTEALAKLKGETFDVLLIAEELSDSAQSIVTTWLNEEYKTKNPHGQIASLNRANASAYATSVQTFNKNVYYINTQTFTVNGETLDLNRSTAYMCGIIAGMSVSRSLTSKIIPNITGVSPEYTTENGDIGAILLNLNIPFIKCKNRDNNEYICVNSMLPNGLDIYINRVRDYVLKTIAIETYLGEQSSDATVEGIDNILETVRRICVEELHLLKDIIYTVEKVSSDCIEIYIDSMKFDGIITKINVYYTIEVE